MDAASIKSLLTDLKNPEQKVRDRATQEIWRIWYQQKGTYGLKLIECSQLLLNAGETDQAETVLTNLIKRHPDFAEAWNRRGLLYYLMGKYQKSLSDCQMVVKLNPVHFGAFHGMGLCYLALGKYREAIKAFRQALEIQPYSLGNQQLILECTAHLS